MKISLNWKEQQELWNDVETRLFRIDYPAEKIITAKQFHDGCFPWYEGRDREIMVEFAADVRAFWQACPWMHGWVSEKADYEFIEEVFAACKL